jgi:phage terminase large subunit-like protein
VPGEAARSDRCHRAGGETLTYERGAAFDGAPATLALARLLDAVGEERAHDLLDEILDGMSVVDLAALESDWRDTWARPKQLYPDTGWSSAGQLMGRGTGKTLTNSKFVNIEVEEGRASRICLMAQDEENCVKLQVTGDSGLIATAPPWFKPIWHISDMELIWPNGAKAIVRTPEVPGKIRGPEFDLSWICEIQSWPVVTRDEALMNVLLATRIGRARIIWDATAKRRHPILRKLMKNAADNPSKHILVIGSTHENRLNLAAGYIEALNTAIGGTQQGDEELHGKMSLDAEGATVKDEVWIERNRRAPPDRVVRRVLSADPAVTTNKGSDNTGIIEGALSVDGKALIEVDHTGKHAPEVWGSLLLTRYIAGQCDLIVVETNKGGDLLVRNIRACVDAHNAESPHRKLHVVVIGKKERAPGHIPGVVHVREIFSRGEKADRAKPLSTAYEKDRVCHVGKFPELEDVLTTWEPVPGARSPDRLDAEVALVDELLGLTIDEPDPKAGVTGVVEANKRIVAPRAPDVSRFRGGRGRRL